MDEAELIKAGQNGDVTAFNRLVLYYQELVYNVCYRVLHDPDNAADVTQETFLSAFRALKSYRGGSFKAWLLRIATNGCYDLLRRRKRESSTPLDDILVDESIAALTDHTPGPEEQALRGELMAYLQQGLASLPVDQRVVVVLSDVHGMSYDEIAQVTNTALGTVKSRLSRGRAHLRDFLLRHRELLPYHLRHDSVR
jgi:RNA polymerase sigma-70 factor (ECF subfamily)